MIVGPSRTITTKHPSFPQTPFYNKSIVFKTTVKSNHPPSQIDPSFITTLNLSYLSSFLPRHTSRSLVKTCTETRHFQSRRHKNSDTLVLAIFVATLQHNWHNTPSPCLFSWHTALNILDICTHTATGIQWCTQFLNALFLFQKAIASFIQTQATTQILKLNPQSSQSRTIPTLHGVYQPNKT